MKTYINTDDVDNLETPLENALGLVVALDDLISRDGDLLFNYPTQDSGKQSQATRLATELQALSQASLNYLSKLDNQMAALLTKPSTLTELLNQDNKDGEE